MDLSLSLLVYFEAYCIHVSTPFERNNMQCLYIGSQTVYL